MLAVFWSLCKIRSLLWKINLLICDQCACYRFSAHLNTSCRNLILIKEKWDMMRRGDKKVEQLWCCIRDRSSSLTIAWIKKSKKCAAKRCSSYMMKMLVLPSIFSYMYMHSFTSFFWNPKLKKWWKKGENLKRKCWDIHHVWQGLLHFSFNSLEPGIWKTIFKVLHASMLTAIWSWLPKELANTKKGHFIHMLGMCFLAGH